MLPDPGQCGRCGMEMLPWRGYWLCVICDNRDDDQAATWFEALAAEETAE